MHKTASSVHYAKELLIYGVWITVEFIKQKDSALWNPMSTRTFSSGRAHLLDVASPLQVVGPPLTKELSHSVTHLQMRQERTRAKRSLLREQPPRTILRSQGERFTKEPVVIRKNNIKIVILEAKDLEKGDDTQSLPGALTEPSICDSRNPLKPESPNFKNILTLILVFLHFIIYLPFPLH